VRVPSAVVPEVVRRQELVGALFGTVALAFLCVVIPTLAVAGTPSVATDWFLAVVIMLWSGLRLAGLLADGKPYLFSVTSWVFVYVFLGLAPLLQIRLGTSPDTTPNILATSIEPAQAIVLLGLGGIEVGTMVGARSSSRMGDRGRVISGRRLSWVAVATFAYVALVVDRIGLAPFFESRNALSVAQLAAFPEPAIAAVISAGLVALPLVTFHALVHHRTQQRSMQRAPERSLMTILMGVILLLTTNVISSPRILFGTVLLSLAILAGATRTMARTRATICALLIGMIIVFPAADLFRATGGHTQSVSDLIDLRQLATSGDYDAFAQIANTRAVVDQEGITIGRQALGVVLFWMPRSVWGDKPKDTGVLVAERRGYQFTNLSAPLWAEAYINGGWLAVPIVMGIFGFIVRRADMKFADGFPRGRIGGIGGAILPFYMMIVLRGSLLAATASLIALMVALWLVSERSD